MRLPYISHFFRLFFECIYVAQFLYLSRLSEKYCSFQVPLVGILKPKKTLVFCQDLSERTFYFRKIFPQQYEKVRFVFCSHFLKKTFSGIVKNQTSKNLFVLHNYTFPKLFSPTKNKHLHKKIHLGFASSWSKEKGIFVFVDFAHLCWKNKLPVTFQVAGDIDLWDLPEKDKLSYFSQVREFVFKNLSNEMGTKILGKIPYTKIPDFYRSLDFLVVPSLWEEPFGNVIIESMSCGTPVATFYSGGIPEIVHDTNGLIAKERTADALYQALTRFLKEKKRSYSQLSKSAIETVQSRFSDKDRYKKLMKLFLSQ